jgi:hypothetical protein
VGELANNFAVHFGDGSLDPEQAAGDLSDGDGSPGISHRSAPYQPDHAAEDADADEGDDEIVFHQAVSFANSAAETLKRGRTANVARSSPPMT